MSENKNFQIFFKGAFYPVSEELFNYYNKNERRTRYVEDERKTGKFDILENKTVYKPSKEDSLDRLIEKNSKIPLIEQNIIEHIENKLLLETALKKLYPDERKIINLLYFQDWTESEVAKFVGITQQSLHRRKHNILLKLNKLINF